MKMMSSIGLVLLVLVAVFGGGCASRRVSQMDVHDRMEIPVLLGDRVYTNVVTHTDRSRIAPGGPRVIRHGGGSFFRFNAAVGGGGGYGYGGGGYSPVFAPITDQERQWEHTQRQYGIGGGGSGSYSPTPMGGSYSPTPMVGGRYGY